MTDKRSTSVYLSARAIEIVKARAEMDGLSISAALEVLIREWHRDRHETRPLDDGTVTS